MRNDALHIEVNSELVGVVTHTKSFEQFVSFFEEHYGLVSALLILWVALNFETQVDYSLLNVEILWNCADVRLQVFLSNLFVNLFCNLFNLTECSFLIRVVQ